MKKLMVVLFLILTTQLTGCFSPSSIDGGEEGVLIKQPWIFGHGGVDPVAVKTGLVWTAFSTSVERYNIKPLKYREAFVDLTASDNVAIDFDSYLTLQIKEGESPFIHENYGVAWYGNKVQDFYRQLVRNEFRTRTSIELRTNPDVIIESQIVIANAMRDYVKENNLPVSVVKVVTGKVVPPQEVLAEAAETAAQKQKNQTQTARAQAELTRKQAETNAALADKAYANEFNMTTEQFLRNKELDIMSKAVESGSVSLIMNASNAEPMFKVGK